MCQNAQIYHTKVYFPAAINRLQDNPILPLLHSFRPLLSSYLLRFIESIRHVVARRFSLGPQILVVGLDYRSRKVFIIDN